MACRTSSVLGFFFSTMDFEFKSPLIGRWYMEHLYETKGSMTQARSVGKKCMHSQLGVNPVFVLGCLKILSLPV